MEEGEGMEEEDPGEGEGARTVDGFHPLGMMGSAPSAGNTATLHVSVHHNNDERVSAAKHHSSVLGR